LSSGLADERILPSERHATVDCFICGLKVSTLPGHSVSCSHTTRDARFDAFRMHAHPDCAGGLSPAAFAALYQHLLNDVVKNLGLKERYCA
jgi:hypothetical protein